MPEPTKRWIVDPEKRRKMEAYRTGQTKGDVVVRGADLADVAEQAAQVKKPHPRER
jgi:ribosomal protein L6P/L9E